METMLFADMLDEIDSGRPFDMTFVKADRRRGTGGEVVRVSNWVKCNEETHDPAYISMPQTSGVGKKPNHHMHKTKNIMNLRNTNVKRKVHVRLICTLNGKTIL